MKSILVCIFSLSLSWGISQFTCQTEHRYIDSIFSQVQLTTGIFYGSANPYNPFVNSQDLFLDFYEPLGDTASARPLIIHAFGGGFLNGTRTSDDIPYWAQEYVEKGFVFASIDYRLGFNPLDGGSIERAAYRCAQDYSAALRFLADNASQYRIDLDNVIVTGNSAGSIGSLIVAFMNDADRPSSTYGTTLEPNDLGCFNCTGNNNYNNEKVEVKACINLWGAVLDTVYIDAIADSADNIPTISFHGDADAVVPYQSGFPYGLPFFPIVYGSESIHLRMDNQQLPNQFVSFPGFPHEPEQDYPWVSDTIVSKASKFLFPFIFGDSAKIVADQEVCVDSVVSIHAELHTSSEYCWLAPNAVILSDSLNHLALTFDTAGSYTVILTETDYKGLSKIDSIVIEVQLPPQSAIDISGQDGLMNLNLLDSSITTAFWELGDGSTSSSLSPVHQYADTGLFNVEVRISNNYCSSDTNYTLIANTCPEAQFNYEVLDSILYLYNSSSLTNEVLWVDGEGSIFTNDTLAYTLENEDDFPLILIASNAYCSDTNLAQLEINFCAEASFTFETNGLQVSFLDESFNAFFYNWDFGDGSSSALPNPNHQYTDAGAYPLSLIVTSMEGCSDTLRTLITVEDNPSSIPLRVQQFNFYPNPSQGEVILQTNFPRKGFKLEIFTMLGALIYEGELLTEIKVLQNEPAGQYLFRLSSKEEVLLFPILKY